MTYECGVDTVDLAVDFAAIIGHTVFEIDDGHGVLERIESRDFLVQAVALERTIPKDAADNAEIDALVSLVDEIGDHFRLSNRPTS